MKISFNWIRELVALPAGVAADDAAVRLTLAGLEVESVERRGREVTGVRVAEVTGVRPHPAAEKLRIVRLRTGDGPEEDVVCGAGNVPGPGGRVAWAPPGATLPGGITLGRKEVRGFSSPGMICSERELGIGEGVDGILILSTADAVGADVGTVLGIVDDVWEVNVTPNRADALSHAGIAREVAALFGVGWTLPAPPLAEITAGLTAVAVDIKDPGACPRYQATVIRGVQVGPSPLWMRMRLAACGMRAISNLVDVTNYVMLETGHPLHAFDLHKLELSTAGIVVRRAATGESMRTLDGVERQLISDDIVIADARKPVALAGVMGGATSEVSGDTTDVLLEAATFDPRAVRRTAKRLGLHSEASHRFERGVDAVGVPTAGARAAATMAILAQGRIAGVPVDQYPTPAEPRRVKLTVPRLRSVAGFDIPIDVARDKLRAIGIPAVVQNENQELMASVPTFRPDISIAEDLVEEVMRLVGYDQVPVRLPSGGKAPEPSPQTLADRARDVLAALGLHEIASWAFVRREALSALGDARLAAAIAVKNPISSDYEVMRTSLIPGLAEAARRNLAHGVSDVRLFEVGPVVYPEAGEEHHRQISQIGGLLVGRRAGWLKPGEPVDFFDLKRVVVELLEALGVKDPVFTPSAAGDPTAMGASVLHPGVSAYIHESRPRTADATALAPASGGAGPGPGSETLALGFAGELHPAVARRFGIDAPAFVFQVELDRLENRSPSVRAAAPARFPAVTRDISFWVDAAASADAQRQALREAGEALLREITVLEDFRDARFVPGGKKGMLWTLTYRADDRTLTDAEVDAAHARVVAALGRELAIEIR